MSQEPVRPREVACAGRVTARRALRYAAGADASEDRPAHVRAASGAAWFRGALHLAQDDAAFVARLRSWDGPVEALALPRLEDGKRLHDDSRGNKASKLDLESCAVLPWRERALLCLFGSGSSPRRERVVTLEDDAPSLADGRALYAALRALEGFATSELNVEGALAIGPRLFLLQRSNGRPLVARPTCAIASLDAAALCDHLRAGAPLPPSRLVAQLDLGRIDDARLTLGDATDAPAGVFYVAAAEASPDATRDGPVAGVRLGRLEGLGSGALSAVQGPIRDERGAPLRDKIEGLAPDPDDATALWAVVDPDDPDAPSALLRVTITL